ncbi:NAD(P)/FAD-dependent oxidoreductase [Aquisediminimonas sediminicola]|uniref:NAD(P)/FAD-dependent oxidoreductase n=1 Tax=Alteraquisediminimonas sediminicola TaxID=2676787 RepID=UPI001C8D1F70|nr:FAD-dependent monooxygenase [Aquisediminimonas sediminicola]
MRPLIIGAGPAGCAAALHLAQRGIAPLVVEQQHVIGDAICGGFLSWTTLAKLDDLGLGAKQLGGPLVTRLRVFADDRVASFPLPGVAMGLSRQRLDQMLVDQVKAAGIEVRFGTKAQHLAPGEVQLADGEVLTAEMIFLANGKHDVRGFNRPADGAGGDPFLGLRFRLTPAPVLAEMVGDAIELHVFAGGYIGINVQEDGSLNCCLAVRKSRYARAGNSLDQLLDQWGRRNPALAARVNASPRLGRTDAIGHLLYGWWTADTLPGIFRLGDQAGVIPSLAGEGIGLALTSGEMAARYAVAGGAAAAPDYQHALAAKLRGPFRWAGLMQQMAGSSVGAAWPLTVLEKLPGLARWLFTRTRIHP